MGPSIPSLTLKYQEMNEVRRKINTICDLLPDARPTGRTIYSDRNRAMDLHRAVWRGAGFWEWCHNNTWNEGKTLEAAMENPS